MPLTLEERERRAYIEGRVEEAELLATAMDGEDSARAEIEELTSSLSKAEDEIGRYITEIDDLKVEKIDLEEEVSHANDVIAELRQQISDAGVDLV